MATHDGITVVGVGRSAALVDTVTITLSAVAIDADAGQAFSAAAHIAGQVLQCVRERGVPDDQVRTRTVSLGPHYRPGPTEEATDYQARHLLTVTTTGTDGVEGLLTDLVRAGGAGRDPAQPETSHGGAESRREVHIDSVELTASDPRQAESTARTAAMIDAREKALSLAALAGRPLGPVCSVREIDPSAGASPLMVREVAAVASMPLASGDEPVSVAVQVRFAWAD